VPDRSTLKGKRDYVIIALLVGCALRRRELATLNIEDIQLREGRWVIIDLRRTCAKLCRKNGGDLEQIKFLLGHSSIQTTERYLGSEQDIEIAVNDNLGL
jgi:integrase